MRKEEIVVQFEKMLDELPEDCCNVDIKLLGEVVRTESIADVITLTAEMWEGEDGVFFVEEETSHTKTDVLIC